MVTSKDVARLAGVSRATVSRALSQPEQVAPETREKVEWAIRELDYSPNLMASSLRANRSRTVGIIVNELKNPFYLEIAGLASDTLRGYGYRTMLSFCNEDPREEEEAIQALLSSRAEGIIFSPTCHNPNIDRLLAKHNVAALQLYRDMYPSLDALLIDDRYGTQIATAHLLAAGHRRILMSERDLPFPSGRDDGYRAAFAAAGLPVDEKYILRVPDGGELGAIYDFMRTNEVTAVIPPSSELSLSTLQALRELGRRVPEDVSVVIYDDLPWAALMDITCVAHPVQEIYDCVAEAIGRHIRGEAGEPKKYLIQPGLVSRGSVRQLG